MAETTAENARNTCHRCRVDLGYECSPGATPPVVLCPGEECATCDYAAPDEPSAPARHAGRELVMSTTETDAACGGCRGIGSHRRHCPRHPDYHPYRQLADRAESIGDSIGVPELANRAWALAGAIRDAISDHPWRPIDPPAITKEGDDV